MNKEEIEKKALEIYPHEGLYDNIKLREGYSRAMSDIMSLPKIKGWVAREDIFLRKGRLLLFGEKPVADDSYGWKHDSFYTELDSSLYPDLKWEDGPKEVELIINKI